MSSSNIINDLMNQTAWQQSMDRQQAINDSVNNPTRNPNAAMGKNDFLMLLAAQLRYQNPLEPKNDGDFAAQLAQFSSLEQMMNMNESMKALTNQQSFGLVGKGVMGIAEIDGVRQPFAGVVDNIFTDSRGVQWAIIREESGSILQVPVSDIGGAYDLSTSLTPDMFITTSNNLMGREVLADWEGKTIDGTVTRITVENGHMFARIERPDGTSIFVPVGAIYDIRLPGTSNEPKNPPKAEETTPPPGGNTVTEPDDDDDDETIVNKPGEDDNEVDDENNKNTGNPDVGIEP